MMRHYVFVNVGDDPDAAQLSYSGHGGKLNPQTGVREYPAPDHPHYLGPYDSAPVELERKRVKADVLKRLLAGDQSVRSLSPDEALEVIPDTGLNRFARGLTARKLITALADDAARVNLIATATSAYAEHQQELAALGPLDRFLSETNVEEVLKLLASGNQAKITALVARAVQAKQELEALATKE